MPNTIIIKKCISLECLNIWHLTNSKLDCWVTLDMMRQLRAQNHQRKKNKQNENNHIIKMCLKCFLTLKRLEFHGCVASALYRICNAFVWRNRKWKKITQRIFVISSHLTANIHFLANFSYVKCSHENWINL